VLRKESLKLLPQFLDGLGPYTSQRDKSDQPGALSRRDNIPQPGVSTPGNAFQSASRPERASDLKIEDNKQDCVVEVLVVVEQLEIPVDARSCNDHVDNFVNGQAFSAKGAIVARSLKTDFIAA